MRDSDKRKAIRDQQRASEEARARLIMGKNDRRDADENGGSRDQRSHELSPGRTEGSEQSHGAEDEVEPDHVEANLAAQGP